MVYTIYNLAKLGLKLLLKLEHQPITSTNKESIKNSCLLVTDVVGFDGKDMDISKTKFNNFIIFKKLTPHHFYITKTLLNNEYYEIRINGFNQPFILKNILDFNSVPDVNMLFYEFNSDDVAKKWFHFFRI